MSSVARRVRVIGRVQGVFFRQSAVDKARELRVGGWVRNCGDGSVEAQVEGDSMAVEAMLDWLGRGPPHAAVDDVRITEAEPQDLMEFEIRR